MDIVLWLHSLVRYLVLLGAIIGLLKALFASPSQIASDSSDRIVMVVFLGLLDLQALLGVLVILLGGLRGPLHPLLMVMALVLAHWLGTLVRRAPQTNGRALRLALYGAPLAIILFGLAILGQLRI